MRAILPEMDAARQATTDRPTGRILVVDDEPRMTASLRALLSEDGHTTEGALSGEDAITRLEKSAFDLIVVDVRMPGLNGMDVLRAARNQNPDRPVIMMTAFASVESAIGAINEGAYDYLVKPIDLTEMRLTVRRAIEKHRLNQARTTLLQELKEKNRTLSRRVVELNALHEVGATLSTTGEIDKLLKSILNLATGVIGANYGSIMLLDPERETLKVAAAIGAVSERLEHAELPVGDSIAGQVVWSGEPLIIEDVESDSRFHRRNRPQFETKSLLCAPLKTPNGVLGVINISDKRDRPTFTREDLRLLATLAAQAAMAIEDARHFQQVRRQLGEITALHELSNRLAEIERTDQMVAVVFEALEHLASSDRIQWWEWQSDRGGLVLSSTNNPTSSQEHKPPVVVTISKDEISDELLCSRIISSELNRTSPDESTLTPTLAPTLTLTGPTAWPAAGPSAETILTVPVRSADHPLGVFVLIRKRRTSFSDHERHLVALVGSQAERIFERQRALLNASRLVTMGKMISEISHDLRKPLTNIRGSLQVLQGRISKVPGTVKILESTDQEIVRLATLVTELVDFANPKRYRTDRRDLSPAIRRAASLVERMADKHGVTLTVDVPELLPAIFCDENQIIEALLNVLTNAIDAMTTGGTLELRAVVKPCDKGGMSCLSITIRDNGPGMERAEIARIFERYYTTKPSGTGLGLPIVQRLIRAHEGEVRAESTPGIGTTFFLELPIR